MEGIQPPSIHNQTQSDSGKQHARSRFVFGFDVQDCSDGVHAAVAEDWCDSGLECLSGGALSLDAPFCNESESSQLWKSTVSTTFICRSEAKSEPQPFESCISLGGGERLDSALGDSITDDILGCIANGIGTMQLGEETGGCSVDRTDDVFRGQMETTETEQRKIREETFNTLNFVSEDGDTALHLALIHEHWTFVHYLLGVLSLDPTWTRYLDFQNHLGQTALHLAVIVDQSECVRALLLGGASPKLQEQGGNTPLHLAVREGRLECVRELTDGRLGQEHLHITNYSGVSALHLAVQKGNEAFVRMLLDAGADINQKDLSSGRSPLHWAVESQSPGMVHLLLRGGAVVKQPSYAGHSPLYCALYRPSMEVQVLLQEAGGSEPPGEEDEDEDEQESEEEEFDDLIINGRRV